MKLNSEQQEVIQELNELSFTIHKTILRFSSCTSGLMDCAFFGCEGFFQKLAIKSKRESVKDKFTESVRESRHALREYGRLIRHAQRVFPEKAEQLKEFSGSFDGIRMDNDLSLSNEQWMENMFDFHEKYDLILEKLYSAIDENINILSAEDTPKSNQDLPPKYEV